MLKRMTMLGCALALVLAWGAARAEVSVPADLGMYARQIEAEAIEAGQAVHTETTFAWSGLPLLSEAENGAVASLFKALRYDTTRQQEESGALSVWELLLQDVPVLDLWMQARDGVYYEQSNLLGGQTVAFTPQTFRMLVARLSVRAQGAIPTNLDVLFSAVMRALGTDVDLLDEETATEALLAYHQWGEKALASEERLRPTVQIPGLYGRSAQVWTVTRAELIELCEAYSDLLAENEALWLAAAQEQLPADAGEESLHETAAMLAQAMRDLPARVQAYLPADIAPLEIREVYDDTGATVVRQVEVPLPEGAHIYIEWSPQGADEPVPLYLSARRGDMSLQARVAYQHGAPMTAGRETQRRDVTIVECTYTGADVGLEAVITRTANVQQGNQKESMTITTECMMRSDALFGENSVVTLSIETTDTASGTQANKYVHNAQTVLRLKGLGFDDRALLTVNTRTTIDEPLQGIVPAEASQVVYPAQMTDEALDAWLAENQISVVQAGLTLLGRLPPDVAELMLTWFD